MSSVIDERIVQMQFDNDKFEKGVTETLESLNKLDNNLNNFGKNNSYFSSLEKGLDNLTEKFSASGMIINGILLSLGQRIEQVLNRSFSKLTSVIRSGMGEYETQLGSTQTILANVKDEGKGIEEVTAALDDLNHYADLTIYNFTEMTRNIGLFTAAGSSLNDSVSAIKGLANAAAIAGVNSQAASRAWYQVSQAMSQGSFRLMDWRSLENAGIAGEQFKRVLEMVAKADGVAIDSLKKKFGGFRNTLQTGWLTAQRFTEAMRIFSGEVTAADLKAKGFNEREIAELQDIAKTAISAATEVKSFTQLIDTLQEAIGSGWAQSFRTIFGDFEEAKEWLTGISNRLNDFIGEIADIRNDLLSLIFDSGKGIDKGSESMHNIVDNILTTFTTAFRAIRTGFMNIFPIDRVKTAAQNALNFVEKITGEFVINERNVLDSMYAQGAPQRVIDEYKASVDAIDQITNDASQYSQDIINTPIKNLMRFGRGVASIFDGIITTIKDIFTTLFSFIPGSEKFIDNIDKHNKSILDTLGDIGDFFTKFYYVFIKNGKILPRILTSIKNKIVEFTNTNPLILGIKDAFMLMYASIKSVFSILSSMNVGPLDVLKGGFTALGEAIVGVSKIIAYGIGGIISLITGNKNNLLMTFATDASSNLLTLSYALGSIGKGTTTVREAFSGFIDKVTELKNKIINSEFIKNIKNFFSQLSKSFNDFMDSNFGQGAKIGVIAAIIGAALAALIKVLSKSIKKITEAIKNGTLLDLIKGWLDSIAGTFVTFAKTVEDSGLNKVSVQIFLIAAALTALSFIPFDNLAKGLGVLVAIMVAVIALMNKSRIHFDFERFGIMTWINNLKDTLASLANSYGVVGLLNGLAVAIVAFTASVIALAFAMKKMPREVILGFIALNVLMLSLLVTVRSILSLSSAVNKVEKFVQAFNNFTQLAGVSAIVIAFSYAITKLSESLIALSNVENSNLFNGILTILAIMASVIASVISIILTVQNSGLNLNELAGLAGIILIFTGSIHIIANALKSLDGITISSGITVILTSFVVSMVALFSLMTFISKKFSGNNIEILDVLSLSASVIAIASSMLIIAESLKLLDKIQISKDVQSTFSKIIGYVIGISSVIAAISAIHILHVNYHKLIALVGTIVSVTSIFYILSSSLKKLDNVNISKEVINKLNGLIIITSAISAVILGIATWGKNIDYGLLIGSIAIISTVSLMILAIGQVLKSLDNIQISTNTMITLLGLTVIASLLSVAIGALAVALASIPGVGEIALAAIAILDVIVLSVAALIASIGLSAYLLTEAVNNILDIFKRIYDGIVYISENITDIKNVLLDFANSIVGLTPIMYKAFYNVALVFASGLAGIFNGLAKSSNKVAFSIFNWMMSTLASLNNILVANTGKIVSVLSSLSSTLFIIFTGVVEQVRVRIFLFIVKTLIDSLSQLFYVVEYVTLYLMETMLNNIINKMKEPIVNFLRKIQSILVALIDVFESITPGDNPRLEEFKSQLDEAINKIDEFEANFVEAGAIVVNTENGIVRNTQKSLNRVFEGTAITSDELRDVVGETSEDITETTDDAWTDIINTFGDGSGDILGYVVTNFDTIKNLNREELADLISSKAKEWGISTNLVDKATDLISDYVSDMANSNIKASADEGEAVNYNVEQAYKKYADTVERYESQIRDLQARAGTARSNALAAEAEGLWDAARGYWNTYNSIKTQITSLQNRKTFDLKLKWRLDQSNQNKNDNPETIADVLSDLMNEWKNFKLPEIDTSGFNYTSNAVDNSSLSKDLKNADKIAADAGKDIENSRADLTPVVDLDKLSSDLKKANGLAQSTLLAAQNAAIGAYINTDSELNPFLKDRYQSVYNFTQNNFSPKALSRIDIYRQTQRQLALSRGF